MPQHLQMKKISVCEQTNKKSTLYTYEITKSIKHHAMLTSAVN